MRKTIALAIIGVCVLSFVPVSASAMTGNGTEGNPYVIYNITDLQNVDNDLTAYYVLNNSIDASATQTWNWNATRGVYEGFDPIGGNFAGSFNGSFYTIDGLYMNWRYNAGMHVGLFKGLTSNAYVGCIYLTSLNITAIAWGSDHPCYVGGLFGGVAASATNVHVEKVATTGVIYGQHTDGGGTRYTPGVGGIVGGLSECNGPVLIEKCASYCNVTCIAYSQAIASAGGFVGMMWDTGVTDIEITDCYAMGEVNAFRTSYPASYAGGFCGYRYGNGLDLRIDNCYSTGETFADDTSKGFVAYTSTCSGVTDSFWDTEASGRSSGMCGSGKTTSEMTTQSTFTNAGWNFTGVWSMLPIINNGYPYLDWWGETFGNLTDAVQVLWFQPNDIIEGTTLPDRAETEDGIITWGANPAGITITLGDFVPEEEYEFEPIIPVNPDIIKPEPAVMTGDVDLEALRNNPLYPLVQILSIAGFLNERLAWLGLAWLIVIIAMLLVHLGPDTRKNTEKPQHFILTTITGLGLSILFYSWGIFPLWVIILMAFGLVGAIIWERQPVI